MLTTTLNFVVMSMKNTCNTVSFNGDNGEVAFDLLALAFRNMPTSWPRISILCTQMNISWPRFIDYFFF